MRHFAFAALAIALVACSPDASTAPRAFPDRPTLDVSAPSGVTLTAGPCSARGGYVTVTWVTSDPNADRTLIKYAVPNTFQGQTYMSADDVDNRWIHYGTYDVYVWSYDLQTGQRSPFVVVEDWEFSRKICQ